MTEQEPKSEGGEMSKAKDELAGFLAELREVVDSSRGVDGWHLNDDIATWDELDITVDRIDAFLQQKQFPEPGVDVHGIAKHIMDTFPRVNDIMTESRLRELIKEGQHES